MKLRDGSLFSLVNQLEGSQTSLFHFQTVEEGCWRRPHLLPRKDRWFGQTGFRPQRIRWVVDAAMKKSSWKDQALASTNALSK